MKSFWYNPFIRIAGLEALLWGLAAMLLASFFGTLTATHFDGVFDLHVGASTGYFIYLIENIIS